MPPCSAGRGERAARVPLCGAVSLVVLGDRGSCTDDRPGARVSTGRTAQCLVSRPRRQGRSRARGPSRRRGPPPARQAAVRWSRTGYGVPHGARRPQPRAFPSALQEGSGTDVRAQWPRPAWPAGNTSGDTATVDPAGARSTQRGRSVRAWCPLLLRRRRLRSAKSRTRLDPGRVAGVEVQRRFPSRGGGEPGPTTAAPVGRWWYSNDEAACPGVTPCSGDSADIGAGTHPRLPPTGPGRERRPRYRRRNAPAPVQKAVAVAEADPERSSTGPEHSRTCRRPPPPDPEGTRARAGRRAGRRTVRSTDRSPRPARR